MPKTDTAESLDLPPVPSATDLVESEGRREVTLSLDLRLQIRDFLLRGGNGIGAGDKAARRRILAGDHNECSRELGGVAN